MLVFIKDSYSHIECDVEGCGIEAPRPDEMKDAHGIKSLGWYVGLNGTHRCPKHHDVDAPYRGPQRRGNKRAQSSMT